MKVLYIVTSFPRDEKDVITPWMIETIERLRARGIEVVVYSCSCRGTVDHELGGIPVRRFRYFFKSLELLSHDNSIPEQIRQNKLYLLLVAPYIVFGVLGLKRLLQRESFDVIHVHWPFPLGIFGYFAGRWSHAPVLSQFYGVELRWVRSKMPVFIPFLRWIIKHSDLVVAISSHTRKEIEIIAPGSRVEIVPFGSPVPPMVESEREAQDPARTRRVLFVGRLVERKGVEYLVRAMKEISCPWPVELDIVGTGPLEENLKALAEQSGLSGRVHLRGKVSTEELKRYYSACDCFVLPAIVDSKGDTEGLGVVLIEALSYRRPVIASDLGGIVDIVQHEKTGLLVPEKDSLSLAAAIMRVLTDKALAGHLAEDGYKFVQSYFDWERITDRWVFLYRELTGKK
jgi:glycosyltransferase involved in cell wall biosynthesis